MGRFEFMPYVSTMEIFQDGLKQGYGTPMFNCIIS